MTRLVRVGLAAAALVSSPAALLSAQHPSGARRGSADTAADRAMSSPSSHEHGAAPPAVTYSQLQRAAELLAAARQATAQYQDVHVAEAAGYRAIGPDVPGMGVHYVSATRSRDFEIAHPPILLYERDTTASGGMRLTGVSYLLIAPTGDDGQPVDSPFSKALAHWHKHNNVCVLPNNDATVDLTELQCTSKGGRFTAVTSWMLHAWIWKDSPAGVFSPVNPLVK